MKTILLLFFLVCLGLIYISCIRIKEYYSEYKRVTSYSDRHIIHQSAVNHAIKDYYEGLLAAVFFACLAVFSLIALIYGNTTWI